MQQLLRWPDRNLWKRVTFHKEQIQHGEYRHLKISEHLAKCNNGYFKIMPIYHCNYPDRLFREAKEQEIITILEPDLNNY